MDSVFYAKYKLENASINWLNDTLKSIVTHGMTQIYYHRAFGSKLRKALLKECNIYLSAGDAREIVAAYQDYKYNGQLVVDDDTEVDDVNWSKNIRRRKVGQRVKDAAVKSVDLVSEIHRCRCGRFHPAGQKLTQDMLAHGVNLCDDETLIIPAGKRVVRDSSPDGSNDSVSWRDESSPLASDMNAQLIAAHQLIVDLLRQLDVAARANMMLHAEICELEAQNAQPSVENP